MRPLISPELVIAKELGTVARVSDGVAHEIMIFRNASFVVTFSLSTAGQRVLAEALTWGN